MQENKLDFIIKNRGFTYVSDEDVKNIVREFSYLDPEDMYDD